MTSLSQAIDRNPRATWTAIARRLAFAASAVCLAATFILTFGAPTAQAATPQATTAEQAAATMQAATAQAATPQATTSSNDTVVDDAVVEDAVVVDVTTKISLADATVVSADPVTYTGAKLTPTPRVLVGDCLLVPGTDCTVSYRNNINAGTATVTLTGINNYTGTFSYMFQILPVSFSTSSDCLADAIKDQTYTGKAVTPNPVVRFGGKVLTKGTDYTVSYKNNINTGTATCTIKGKGNFSGTIVKTFEITDSSAKTIASSWITLSATSATYNGKNQTPTITVRNASGTTLKRNKDYTVSITNSLGNSEFTCVEAKTYTISIYGCGKYSGKATKTFTIKRASLAKAKVTGISNATYTGKAIKPSITLTLNGTKIAARNYQVTYSNNTKVGKATVTITGKNGCKGSLVKTFYLYPQATTFKTTSGVVGGFSATWTKKTAQVDGYQIAYCKLGAAAGTKATVRTIAGAKCTGFTQTGLAKGVTYVVQIRTYKDVGGVRYYSAWSSAKNVTTKKK